MRLTLKGSSTSGWYAPPRGTHSGGKHRAAGSGRSGAKYKKKAVSAKTHPKVGDRAYVLLGPDVRGDLVTVLEYDAASGYARVAYASGGGGRKHVDRLEIVGGREHGTIEHLQKMPGTLAENIVRPPSKALDERIDDNIRHGAHDWGVSEEEYVAEAMGNLHEYINESDVAIRVPTDIVDNILDAGEFRNQHHADVTTSQGFFNPATRADVEARGFNLTRNEEPSAYPVYGYLSSDVQAAEDASHYGDVEFILKSSVVPRTTITVGDSLNHDLGKGVGASPMSAPTKHSLDANDSELYKGNFAHIDYIEAQIHGGVKMSDVQEVILHGRHTKSDVYDLQTKFISAGIDFTDLSQPFPTW